MKEHNTTFGKLFAIAALILVVVSASGCGKYNDGTVEAKDIRKALDETGLRVKYAPAPTIPARIGINTAIGGTAYDDSGHGITFLWTLWDHPERMDQYANWVPRIGKGVKINSCCHEGNARFYSAQYPSFGWTKNSKLQAKRDRDGLAYARIEALIGRELLRKISPYEYSG